MLSGKGERKLEKGALIPQLLTSENARPLWFLHLKAEEDVLGAELTQLATAREVAGEEMRMKNSE